MSRPGLTGDSIDTLFRSDTCHCEMRIRRTQVKLSRPSIPCRLYSYACSKYVSQIDTICNDEVAFWHECGELGCGRPLSSLASVQDSYKGLRSLPGSRWTLGCAEVLVLMEFTHAGCTLVEADRIFSVRLVVLVNCICHVDADLESELRV